MDDRDPKRMKEAEKESRQSLHVKENGNECSRQDRGGREISGRKAGSRGRAKKRGRKEKEGEFSSCQSLKKVAQDTRWSYECRRLQNEAAHAVPRRARAPPRQTLGQRFQAGDSACHLGAKASRSCEQRIKAALDAWSHKLGTFITISLLHCTPATPTPPIFPSQIPRALWSAFKIK
eukprot:6212321-Pleurochrysis_carterae.AAC.3